MSVENNKPYKIYISYKSNLYIIKGDILLYYKKPPHEKNEWHPFDENIRRRETPYKVSVYKNYMTLVRTMSEEEFFLELL